MFFLPALLYFGRSAASGLPCAGAAPPQRPPTKPSLTDRVYSSPASCLANGVYPPLLSHPPNPCSSLAVPPAVPPAAPLQFRAPLQNHPSPTVFTLPQHRVWRTESTPPLAVLPPLPLWFPCSSPCSSPAVLRAPLQNHLSPTGFILPQHRVWRTESTPPLAA